MLATRLGDADAVRLLLLAGASPSVTARDGQSPLQIAAGAGNTAVLDQLIAAKADVSARDKLGRSALWRATAAEIASERGLDQLAQLLGRT